MEGAFRPVIAPGPLELDIATNDFVNRQPIFNFLDIVAHIVLAGLPRSQAKPVVLGSFICSTKESDIPYSLAVFSSLAEVLDKINL